MIIRARQDGNIIVFDLEGQLDFESTSQFETTCRNIINKTPASRLVLNMEKLKFVGSSGINHFIRILKNFNQMEAKPRICRASSEFEKIFKAYQTARNPFELFPDEREAIASFDLPPAPKKLPRKKKQIEN